MTEHNMRYDIWIVSRRLSTIPRERAAYMGRKALLADCFLGLRGSIDLSWRQYDLFEVRRSGDACRHLFKVQQREPAERNRTRLRVFDDPTNVERLINLPESMMRSLARLPDPGYNDAVRAQTALAIAIELVAPLRAKNLAGLRLDRHIVHSRPGPGAVMHLVVPTGEVKNNNPLEFELPSDVVRILELYLQKFRPLLVADGSSYLFPARQGGAKTPAQLAEQIKRDIKKGIGLTVNAHLFRHVCAYLYLKAHPGDYETVRLLLGHKSLATTVRAYCGLERSDAVRRYDRLIDTYRRSEGDESYAR